MHDDDRDSASSPEDTSAASDPFQELERMFGDSGAAGEAGSEAGSSAEGGSAGAGSEEAAEPFGAGPSTLDSAGPSTPDVPSAEDPDATLEISPLAVADSPPTQADSSPTQTEPAPTQVEPVPTRAESAPGVVDAPPAPDLGALVAALDAASTASDMPTFTGAAAEPASKRRRGQRYIVFSVGTTRYAIAMGQVVEVGAVPAVTPLPKVPSWLLGVSNLRGDVLAVLDFRRFLGHASTANSERDRMLVLDAGDGSLMAGLVVDRVLGVGSVDPADIHPPTAPVEDPVHEYLLGVAERDERLLAILDAGRLLTASELQPFSAGETSANLSNPDSNWSEPAESAGSIPIQ